MAVRLTWLGIILGSLASIAGLACLWICFHLVTLAFQKEPFKPGDYFPTQLVLTIGGVFMGAVGLCALFMGIRFLTTPSLERSTPPSRRRRFVFGIIGLILGAAGFAYGLLEGRGTRAWVDTPAVFFLAGAFLLWSARRGEPRSNAQP